MLNGSNGAALDINASSLRPPAQRDAYLRSMNHETYGTFPRHPTKDDNVLQSLSAPLWASHGHGASPMLNRSSGAALNIDASSRRLPAQRDAYLRSEINRETYGTFPRHPTKDDNVLQSLSAPPWASHGYVSNATNRSTTGRPDMGSQRPSAYSNPYRPTFLTASHNRGSADQNLMNFPNDGVVVKAHDAGDSGDVGCIHLIPAPAFHGMPPPRNPYVDHDAYSDYFGNLWVEGPEACNSGRPYGTPSTYEQRTPEALVNQLAYSVHRQVKKGVDAAGRLFGLGERNDAYLPHYGYDAQPPLHRLDLRDTQASTARLLTTPQTPAPSTLSECSFTPKAEPTAEPCSFEATPEPPPGLVDLPLEVDKMVNASRLGIPVIVIASREVLDDVGLKLPQEFGYTVLGCFEICSQQTLRDTTESEYEVFEWQFRIRWMQGTEGQFFREGIEPELMSSPWWSDTKETEVSSDCPDVLPLDLLSESCVSAVGWYCHACGKINQQTLFRHSKCSSSFCKGKPAQVRPTVTLEQLVTNPQDKLNMANPLYLRAPNSGKAYNIDWEDGMRTFKYHLGIDRLRSRLSEEVTDLFYDIQTEVELVLDGVFFQCTITPSDWDSASTSVKNAREWMLHMGHTYSDLPNPETTIKITSLSIFAWWREGSRKTSQPLLAKSHPVVVACLGQAITFTLKRVARIAGKEAVKSPAKRTGKAQKQATMLLTLDGGEADLNTPSKDKEPLQHDVVISMVHGDVLVLGGGDYEYQLKRHGAGIILIGTQ
ncbi:hypothetical protein BDZ89DRAFT_1129355 [Hymenopellis radicata]|nr:hypothetical protein BDZ89DRAFT_1129355 [Hymenopellis radicata]